MSSFSKVYHEVDLDKIKAMLFHSIIRGSENVKWRYDEVILELHNVRYRFSSEFPKIEKIDREKDGYVITKDGLIEWKEMIYISSITNEIYHEYIGTKYYGPVFDSEIICINYVCSEKPKDAYTISVNDLYGYDAEKFNDVPLEKIADIDVSEIGIELEGKIFGSISIKMNDFNYALESINKDEYLFIPYGTCYKIYDKEIKDRFEVCIE